MRAAESDLSAEPQLLLPTEHVARPLHNNVDSVDSRQAIISTWQVQNPDEDREPSHALRSRTQPRSSSGHQVAIHAALCSKSSKRRPTESVWALYGRYGFLGLTSRKPSIETYQYERRGRKIIGLQRGGFIPALSVHGLVDKGV